MKGTFIALEYILYSVCTAHYSTEYHSLVGLMCVYASSRTSQALRNDDAEAEQWYEYVARHRASLKGCGDRLWIDPIMCWKI